MSAPAQQARVVPVHPEPVSGSTEELRWVLPAGILPVGRVRAAPGRLGEMFDEGLLCDPLAERAALWLRLGSGTWREHGAAVREALQASLLDPGAWVLDDPDDAGLERVSTELLAGPVGDYVRSHGGRITVAEVHDAMVDLDLDGTCGHCPAAGLTLHARVESALRERWPDLVCVRDVHGRA